MIEIHEDLESLSRSAAEIFCAAARKSVTAKGRFSVLMAGGETPQDTYRLLAKDPLRSLVPWHAIHVFWGDERCVSPVDKRNNALMAWKVLFSQVPIPIGQVHPIQYVTTPEDAADDYESLLRTFFLGSLPVFDLVFLGLGADGHTASLLPDSAALDERQRWTAVTGRVEEPFKRVTLTPPVINSAELVVFLVAGGGKSDVLHTILGNGTAGKMLPAGRIKPATGTLRWLVDREAARLLEYDYDKLPVHIPRPRAENCSEGEC